MKNQDPLKPETYIGDGVYAEVDHWGRLILRKDEGLADTIVLEPEVLGNLLTFIQKA